MNVLIVTHDFLPRHRAGAEICAFWLARSLRELGHDARVFTTDKALAKTEGSIRNIEVEGVPVWEMTRNRMFHSLQDTWEFPAAGHAFRQIFKKWRPSVVHFHHLMYLSFDLPSIARSEGCHTVMTLHDFWLQCQRMGQRRDPWGEICFNFDDMRCSSCLLACPPESASPCKRFAAGVLRWLRRLTRIDLGPWARRKALQHEAEQVQPDEGKVPQPPATGPLFLAAAGAIANRRQAVFDRVIPYIQYFRAPSRFLAKEMINWGVPAEKVHWHPYGIDLAEVPKIPRAGKVRFAFLGTVAPHKGVHLLLEAFRGLKDCAELTIHGGAPYHAAYAEKIKQLCTETGATWTGPYQPAEFGRLLGSCDCLVVPSLWFENAPLTILQARRSHIPVLVTDLGGMAELVADGAGWSFPLGDREALAQIMAQIAREPEMLEFDPADFNPPTTVLEDAAEHVTFYEDLLTGRLP